MWNKNVFSFGDKNASGQLKCLHIVRIVCGLFSDNAKYAFVGISNPIMSVTKFLNEWRYENINWHLLWLIPLAIHSNKLTCCWSQLIFYSMFYIILCIIIYQSIFWNPVCKLPKCFECIWLYFNNFLNH